MNGIDLSINLSISISISLKMSRRRVSEYIREVRQTQSTKGEETVPLAGPGQAQRTEGGDI